MELLGTVHWVMKEKPTIADCVEEVVKFIDASQCTDSMSSQYSYNDKRY